MDVAVGRPFTANLVVPPGDWVSGSLGARVEAPVTRAIVSRWVAATENGSVLTATLDGPVDPGEYQLVWMPSTDPPAFEYFIPLTAHMSLAVRTVDYPEVDEGEVRPSVDDVARLMRTRTVGAGSEDTGTFTEDTDPTSDEVENLIDQASDDVLSQLPIPQVNPQYYPQIKRAITLQTVLLADPSYWREEAGDEALKFFQSMYQTTITGVQGRIQRDLDQANVIGGMEPSFRRQRLEARRRRTYW